jgi:hypothetical protein
MRARVQEIIKRQRRRSMSLQSPHPKRSCGIEEEEEEEEEAAAAQVGTGACRVTGVCLR